MLPQPFDPVEFLTVAQQLALLTADERLLRTAIGRAYYAVFLVARSKTGVSVQRDVHKTVIQTVKRRQGFRTVGDDLDALRRLRVVADYQLVPVDVNQRNWAANWQRAEALAQRVLLNLQKWT